MQLHEADVVFEAYSLQDANKAIKDGWKLLAITSVTNPQTSPQFTCVCYVLGKKSPGRATSVPLNM
ncbi:hypothetical protein C1170_06190 [Stutzerimonas frequens]|uniref:Uncharacterized protein n=1 Tax=Stutzerimonas frequens TaxID=2968969 RepID=A0ABX6XYD6_9GAMM|nr:hypothetical protein [Stutzerimonas frequens]MCQ4302716.1 hypothetical protein [Stutzerimonas frequens]PNF52522.1 hypothetical protein C1170_06190 [Stutzerimonas frequens]QPT19002.1 hypothetical protein I6G34_06490 [Stutzerimonas frequens]